jgi:hypothetical protein
MIYSVKDEPGKEPRDWKVVPFVNVGTNELFQARFLNLADLLRGAMWETAAKEKLIMDAFFSMLLEGFTPAFLHLRQAIKLSQDSTTPILNLRTEYDAFYSKLWTAYEHRFADLLQEMGYKVRFLFAENDKKFEEDSAKFAQQHGIPSDVIAQIKLERDAWQNKLATIRNKVVIHARIPAEEVPVIYKPSTAQAYFDSCWQMAEWLTANLMAKHLPESLALYDLPEYLSDGGRKAFTVQFKPGVKFVAPQGGENTRG